MRRRNNPDVNQPEIVQALRDIGAMVFLIGRPFDLLVCWRGHIHIMEIKNPAGENRLSISQKKDIEKLKLRGVEVDVVRSVDEALSAVTSV